MTLRGSRLSEVIRRITDIARDSIAETLSDRSQSAIDSPATAFLLSRQLLRHQRLVGSGRRRGDSLRGRIMLCASGEAVGMELPA